MCLNLRLYDSQLKKHEEGKKIPIKITYEEKLYFRPKILWSESLIVKNLQKVTDGSCNNKNIFTFQIYTLYELLVK